MAAARTMPACASRNRNSRAIADRRQHASGSLPRLTPCGRTRREFIWQAGGGFVGTALTYLLAQDGFFEPRAGRRVGRSVSLLAPKPAHFAPKAKSCIFLFMYGGPSHVDLFDPKPELTKRNGQPMPELGKRPALRRQANQRQAAVGQPVGIQQARPVGHRDFDLFPKLAECVDDMAIIRSCHADSFAHGSGLLQMNTGSLRQGYPSLGSWVTYGLGTVNQNLPAYVVLLDHRGGPIGGAPNWGAGFMPAGFQGTQFRTSGDPIIDLSPPRRRHPRAAAAAARPARRNWARCTASSCRTTPSWRRAWKATSWPSACSSTRPRRST